MPTHKILQSERGLTLIEITITVGILAMLASIVIVGVNPKKQIDTTHNAQRLGHIATIAGGINHYAIDTFSDYPAGIDTTLRMLGTGTSSCAVTCGPGTLPEAPAGITTFTDDTQIEFDAGTYIDTQGSAGLSLTPTGQTARTGTYLSNAKDAGSETVWNSLGWAIPAPYGKELPINQQSESGYPIGNASMAGNVAYHRMSSIAGPIADSSGTGNNATIPSGGVTATTGLLNNGFVFAGGNNNYMQIVHNASLNLPNTGGTVMLWIRPNITAGTLPQNSGMGILRKPDYGGNIYSPGGYGLEIYRNLTSQPAYIKMHLGWNSGLSSSQQTLTGTVPITTGNWHHVAITWNASTMNIYVNGALDISAPRTSGPLNWVGSPGNVAMYIGHRAASQSTGYAWYNGTMDELAIFNRPLNLQEINGAYQRGAFHPKLQVRTCDDNLCSGEPWIGPDGTGATYFNETGYAGLTPLASFTLPALAPNRYFQYQVILDTQTTAASPTITSIAGGNNGQANEGGTSTTETTAEACLDLSTQLVPTFINNLPFDPVTGNTEKTQYAVKRIPGGLLVRACTPDLNASIQVEQ